MLTESLFPLAGFAFVTSITPGPNNTMLLQSGVHYGFRATIPHILGINAGLAAVVACVGLGMGELLKLQPMVYLALRYACAAYMVFLVWRIGTAGDIDAQDHAADRPMRLLEAAAFQWVNPKVWVLALGAVASYETNGAVGHTALFIAVVCALINAPCLVAWAGFGVGVRDSLSTRRRVHAFNWTMAVLLAISIIPLFEELATGT